MSAETSTLSKLYSKIAEDPRVNVWHVSLFTFLLNLWQKSGYQQQLKVSRKQLMVGGHISSITTYHKCISQLTKLGYILYIPSYDVYKGTKIVIVL
ncbi:hypothetical protein BDD43_4844 [Mucilaginibacter gracilis]|uniref:Transcriptional regulator n=1 Tax=Mucilaginibacter gracilis TaxID=423350 RepID=A0A495J831_9SPHI|nr:hypothetical protein [Mucilaginibacter gracilis]RKR84598.1 hypothetical protein BDD43_4844 [Mucilaginibacter gracilis]